MKSKVSAQEVWKRELRYATGARFWRTFACELRNCAEFLLADTMEGKSPGSTTPVPAFFPDKFARLFLGLSLENLAKGLLLGPKYRSKFIKYGKGGRDPRITFGARGHDLEWLLRELSFDIQDPPQHVPPGFALASPPTMQMYLRIWSASTTWYGKYPFPLDVSSVLTEYAPLSSSAALLKRVKRGGRQVTERDLLHNRIGHRELTVFDRLFKQLESRYE